MIYRQIYESLKDGFNNLGDSVSFPELGIKITKKTFKTNSSGLLFGSPSFYCEEHSLSFQEENIKPLAMSSLPQLNQNDYHICCNNNFNYYIMQDISAEESSGVVFLFHGLNEKNWNKYLPWGYKIAKDTGKAVILFPIAFHMDRAHEEWSNARLMQKAAEERLNMPHNAHATFVNAAISSRLEANPQRIFWSGFQTYMDFCDLTRSIRKGTISGISRSAKIDLFGYSIGAYFAMILMMANPDNELNDSRFVAFCGTAPLDRMFPISKYILDMRASIAIQTYFMEVLENDFCHEKRLSHYLSPQHIEQSYFKIMIQYKSFKEKREKRIAQIHERIYAMVLQQDEVVPADEVMNMLKGGFRNIPTKVDNFDFPYPYDHIKPFSLVTKYEQQTDSAFQQIMGKASAFLA